MGWLAVGFWGRQRPALTDVIHKRSAVLPSKHVVCIIYRRRWDMVEEDTVDVLVLGAVRRRNVVQALIPVLQIHAPYGIQPRILAADLRLCP